jgi:hypothetical protein
LLPGARRFGTRLRIVAFLRITALLRVRAWRDRIGEVSGAGRGSNGRSTMIGGGAQLRIGASGLLMLTLRGGDVDMVAPCRL